MIILKHMKRSKYQNKKIIKLKERALKLYKQGLTTRDVGKIVGRSHAWVAIVVKELDKD